MQRSASVGRTRRGEHGRGRRKESGYSLRLREKQRLRAQSAVSEAQLVVEHYSR